MATCDNHGSLDRYVMHRIWPISCMILLPRNSLQIRNLTLLSAPGGGVHCNFFLASAILSDEDVAVDDDKSPEELFLPPLLACSMASAVVRSVPVVPGVA